MFHIQTFLKIFFLSCIFTLWIYGIERIFFVPDLSEESYIEPSIPQDFLQLPSEEEDVVNSNQTGVLIQESWSNEENTQPLISPQKFIEFSYIPVSFENEAQNYVQLSNTFLKTPQIEEKIDTLSVEFYKKSFEVRGKMKNKTLKIWGLVSFPEWEFLSVFIHEFAHYIDIYFFSPSLLWDISDTFYKISWESATIMKKWQKTEDFVSGYAATNQYEDFAESFTYFILHNKDFIVKTGESEILLEKYNFFQDFLFSQWEFSGTDFWEEIEIKSYYWDITKISIQIQNFLQYLQNDI